MIVQSGPTQSTRRLHMELNTTTLFSPLPPKKNRVSRPTPGVRTELPQIALIPPPHPTSGALEVALYHALGDLPEPERTHRFC